MPITLPKFFKLSASVFVLLLATNLFLTAKIAKAANAIPAPPPIPCDQTSNPEFSSDRPYQASNCGDRPITYWCGNDVVVDLGSVSVPYCAPQSGGATECPADITKFQKIDIDLTNVQLPILGNTQLTKNSQSATDQIDDGTKASNYVAWYLGGTNGHAEYGAESDPATIQGISKIVDTSGPVKKLLPSVLQDSARLNSIHNASTNVTYTPDSEGSPTASSPPSVTEPLNHNQIVVCAKPDSSGIWGGIQDILGLGKFNAVDCYSGGGGGAQGGLVMRLKDWTEGTLPGNAVANIIIQGIIQGVKTLLPFLPTDQLEISFAHHWTRAIPPLPWDDGTGHAFASDAEYKKAYLEWQGNTCGIIPVINYVICVGNIFVPTKYADFYQYVPLANTTDKQSSHLITNTHLSAPRATIDSCPNNSCYFILHIPGLKTPHTEESYTLSQELKSTYVPATESAVPKVPVFPAATMPNDVEDNNSTCRIIPSRTNPGDDVVFDNHPSHMEVDVQYHINMIQCTTPQYECTHLGRGPTGPVTCEWRANCQSEVYATIDTISKTSYDQEIWNNTVANSDSIFRRIYPKTGPMTPVSCIGDTPASSNATYTLSNAASPGLSLLKVIEPDGSAVSGGGGAQSIDAQLYYPHIGGVLDYFLNGIQQALRPLGYGPGQPVNGQYCTNISCGELPKGLEKGSGSCNLGSTHGLTVPPALKQIIESAAQTYNTPPGLILGIMYGEGLFNPGRLNWTDQNVKNWATCQRVPGCNETGDDNFMGFNGSDFSNITPHILKDLQKLDPTKKKLSQCNLLDAIYAEAWNLHDSADGTGGVPATCYGIKLSAPIPSSCSWTPEQYAGAIKIAENGYDNGCFTKENSCATGGGNDALCPTGGDTCETINHQYPNPSHFRCIWDVAH